MSVEIEIPKIITEVTPEWLEKALMKEVQGATDIQILSLNPGKVVNGILSAVAMGRVKIR